MNPNYKLPIFVLAALACLFPATANAQVIVNYDQSLSFWPAVSHVENTASGTPLNFSQANAYTLPPAYSQADMYSQPLSYAQANMYSPSYNYRQPSMTLVEEQSSGIYSSTPAHAVEVAIPQVPTYSAPVQSYPPPLPQPETCHT